MIFSKQVARKAFHGCDILHNPELVRSGDVYTNEHAEAINAVTTKYDEFCDLIRSELKRFPLTEQMFGTLIQSRLQQNEILRSPVIQSLLYDDNVVEERLQRLTGGVANLDHITKDVYASGSVNDGLETDEKILDCWNEIFVMDFLIQTNGLKFTGLNKVVRGKNKPQADLLAERQGKTYVIEITRIRERAFKGITYPTMFDAINEPSNLRSLHNILLDKMTKKNDQMQKFCSQEKQVFDKKLVILKTSQWEYQDAKEVLASETQSLFDKGSYHSIDEVLLIFDLENYAWIKRSPSP